MMSLRPPSSAPFSPAPFAPAPFAPAPFAQAPFAPAPFAQAPFAQAPFAQAPFAPAPFAAALFAVAAALAALFAAGPAAAQPDDAARSAAELSFRIETATPGVYRLTFDQLAAAAPDALPADGVASGRLLLTHRDRPEGVPIRVADGGDGVFGPGERIEWVAQRLAGASTFHHPYSPVNVYRLRFLPADSVQVGGGPQAAPPRLPPVAAGADPGAGYKVPYRRRHLEEDRLLIRLAAADVAAGGEAEPELWYWGKLTHIDRQPFTVELDFSDLDRQAAGGVLIELGFRGLSKPYDKAAGAYDHQVEVSLAGPRGEPRRLGGGRWNGTAPFRLRLPALAPDEALPARTGRGRGRGGAQLTVRVPERRTGPGGEALIDVVMLDWVEITYPHTGRLPAGAAAAGDDSEAGGVAAAAQQVELTLPSAFGVGVKLTAEGARGRADRRPIAVYGAGGGRAELPAGGRETIYLPAAGEESLWAVAGDALLPPVSVARQRPPRLALTATGAAAPQADYLMIAHRSLLDAAAPLAELHRSRGLSVALIDVQEIYDSYNGGIVHPRAIRDFIAHAYHRWAKPAPRFVLLVGDASWDIRDSPDDARYANWVGHQLTDEEGAFPAKRTTDYEGPVGAARNLIPTWTYHSLEGHSASDNGFVTVAGAEGEGGDDPYPELAIGRLPVATPGEVAAIVAKTARRIAEPELGPWRRRLLWVTDEFTGFQQRSDRLAGELARQGYASTRVYPAASEADNAGNRRRLLDAFSDGQALVHFVGHGGRFIWRTGPPTPDKDHDLFTLEDLDRLPESGRLPLVLSLTCHTGPFDHPSADSIGEKFLRLPRRGAVAVLAASWRNNPSTLLSQTLIEELFQPAARGGNTVGEAIMRTKRRLRDRDVIETYNLLGDPALPVALPAHPVTVTGSAKAGLTASLPVTRFNGRALVEYTDADGEPLASRELTVANPRFPLPEPPAGAMLVTVYAWDEQRGVDGVGGLALNAGGTDPPPQAPGRAGNRGRR